VLAVILNIAGLLCAATVNSRVLAITLIAIILLTGYNFLLKRIILIGNITIGLLGGLTFITGGLAVDPVRAFDLPGPLIPAIYAILVHVIRELLKDAYDIHGDKAVQTATLPQLLGVRFTAGISLVVFFVLAFLTIIPMIQGWFGRWYELITLYLVDLPMFIVLVLVFIKPDRKWLRIGSITLKVGMALGIIAILVA
jgi:geranylgeranylglycerol-phosphate geranylgeranyltransferase